MPAPDNDFEKASQQKQGSLVSEFIGFMKQNKKFWLLPLILVLLLIGLIVVFGGSSAVAPFVYTLF